MKQSITCLLLFAIQLCYAQDMWINYTNTHRINDVIETDQGFWLGSEGGLCYYNTESGAEAYYNRGNSNIPSNSVIDLLYGSDEEVWLVTGGGLCMFNGNDFDIGPENVKGILRETLDEKLIVLGYDSMYIQDEGMEFTAVEYPEFAAAIGGAEVDQETGAIYVFVNNWFAESYLAVWQNEEWSILSSEYIYDSAMTMDKDSKLWLVNHSGLQYFEDDNWIVVPEAELEADIRFAKLFVNIENQIVILNNSDCITLSVWDGLSLEELDYSTGDCPHFEYFIKPSDRESGLYYASQLDDGFYSFTKDGINDSKRLSQSPILHNFVRKTLHPNDDGHIIVYNNGIQHIKSGVWNEIALPDDLTGNVHDGFLDPDENLWIYDNEFLWSYQDEEWTKLNPPAEITDNLELMEIGANGDIWIQSELIIARYRDGTWNVYKAIHHDITSSIIKDMKVDPINGDLWVTTFQGVRQFDGQTWTNYTVEPINHTFGLAIRNGGAFVLANYDLIFIRDGELDTIPLPIEGDYNRFVSEMIYNPKDDKLYLAGTSSLAVYYNEEWTVYNTYNSGHYDTSSNDVSIDNNDNIWLSGNRGGIGIFNSAGISLSLAEEDKPIDGKPLIKIYPTLLTHDAFFIKSEISGVYDISVSDVAGKIIYKRQHRLINKVPEEIKISNLEVNLLLVTVSNATMMVTEKVCKIGQ